MIDQRPILFSGVRPSGKITLGNYIGTIRHWSSMQDDYQSLYCIADLHALTTFNKRDKITDSVLDMIALYLSCGINPDKSIIFIQSHVHYHCQLNWILNSFVHFGELKRMNQFKSYYNAKKISNIGVFNYPVLMASDILLYKTNIVPIGEDQKQHLELVRRIAKRFNSVNGNIFTIPKPLINKHGSKIMSLLDPSQKMSKSDHNINNVIFLLEDHASVFLKIKNAKTDSEKPSKIYYDVLRKPGISNLLEILSAVTKKDITVLEKELDGIVYAEFKNIVAEELCMFLSHLQRSYR
ncbi:tryptophan--tRNA ligase, partial [Buchnera aphidicola]|nr:tryptophan--tRNA ligase [Buchnera aphidicola]